MQLILPQKTATRREIELQTQVRYKLAGKFAIDEKNGKRRSKTDMLNNNNNNIFYLNTVGFKANIAYGAV